MTQRNILLEPFISQQGKKGKKMSKLTLFFLCTKGTLIVVKHIHHVQFWHLPEQNQILVPGQQNDRTWGRISCHRQSCVSLFALAKCPFIYVNLQPFFSVQGHPLESLLQRKIVQTLMKTVMLPPLLILLGYVGQEKNAATHQNGEKKLTPLKQNYSAISFFHTSHLSGLPHEPGSSKTIYQQAGLGPPNQPFLESFGLPVWLEK